jgi:hypothetical protein
LYPTPPDDPDLPVGEDVPVFSVVLTTDATSNAFIARPIPRPISGEPRDMDIEIYVTARLANLSSALNFSRYAKALNLPEGKEARIRAHYIQYAEFGRTVSESPDYFQPAAPKEVLGTETREWSYMPPDEGGWKIRLRVRFRSDHSDWQFHSATILVHFEEGRTENVPLFTQP